MTNIRTGVSFGTEANSYCKNINKASFIENPGMKKEAAFWKPIKNETVQCFLCPHHCVIAPEKRGICGVRKNEHGKLFTLIYGACSSVADDPIEKKPLYHFYPGSLFCLLALSGVPSDVIIVRTIIFRWHILRRCRCRRFHQRQSVRWQRIMAVRGVAWTYNEPTIWYEYTLDAAKLVKNAGSVYGLCHQWIYRERTAQRRSPRI